MTTILTHTDTDINTATEQRPLNLFHRLSGSGSVLSPQTWPFSLKCLPPDTYLVGGNVRDALMGRHADYLDLDFVLPTQAVETAQAIANRYAAGFVVLDADRQIARVVFDHATADFAQQVGNSLEDDLRRRDFTVNAIAYNPFTEQLVDPLQGYADLYHRQIRMIAPENLVEDPLRLLRAYRQSAQLDFTLDAETQTTIRQLATLLQRIAAERVQAELNYLLGTPQGTGCLKAAWQDGLLQFWLPHMTASGLERVARVDTAAIALSKHWQSLASELINWVKDQQKASGAMRSWLKVAKLANLVSSDPVQAEQDLWRLKYSRTEVQAVLTVLKVLPQLDALRDRALTAREQFYLFRQMGSCFPAVAVATVAQGISLDAIAPWVEHFLQPDNPIAHPKPLLSGRDLMQELRLPAGPQIGHLLELIQVAQAEGQVSTPAAALVYAQQQLQSGDWES